MKKILVLFYILFATCVFIHAQNEKVIAFQKGTVLAYEMTKDEQTFTFTITIESLKPDLVYNFKLEGPDKKSGKVTMHNKALLSSGKLVFDFSQSKLSLDNATCLFISQSFFDKLDSIASLIYNDKNPAADSSYLPLVIGNPGKVVMLGRFAREVEEIAVNSRPAKLYTYSFDHAIDSNSKPVEFGTSYIFRVARNTEYHLITYANLITYSIALIEVKNAQWLRFNYSNGVYERVNDIDD